MVRLYSLPLATLVLSTLTGYCNSQGTTDINEAEALQSYQSALNSFWNANKVEEIQGVFDEVGGNPSDTGFEFVIGNLLGLSTYDHNSISNYFESLDTAFTRDHSVLFGILPDENNLSDTGKFSTLVELVASEEAAAANSVDNVNTSKELISYQSALNSFWNANKVEAVEGVVEAVEGTNTPDTSFNSDLSELFDLSTYNHNSISNFFKTVASAFSTDLGLVVDVLPNENNLSDTKVFSILASDISADEAASNSGSGNESGTDTQSDTSSFGVSRFSLNNVAFTMISVIVTLFIKF